jgi:hypothetical protein
MLWYSCKSIQLSASSTELLVPVSELASAFAYSVFKKVLIRVVP